MFPNFKPHVKISENYEIFSKLLLRSRVRTTRENMHGSDTIEAIVIDTAQHEINTSTNNVNSICGLTTKKLCE